MNLRRTHVWECKSALAGLVPMMYLADAGSIDLSSARQWLRLICRLTESQNAFDFDLKIPVANSDQRILDAHLFI